MTIYITLLFSTFILLAILSYQFYVMGKPCVIELSNGKFIVYVGTDGYLIKTPEKELLPINYYKMASKFDSLEDAKKAYNKYKNQGEEQYNDNKWAKQYPLT